MILNKQPVTCWLCWKQNGCCITGLHSEQNSQFPSFQLAMLKQAGCWHGTRNVSPFQLALLGEQADACIMAFPPSPSWADLAGSKQLQVPSLNPAGISPFQLHGRRHQRRFFLKRPGGCGKGACGRLSGAWVVSFCSHGTSLVLQLCPVGELPVGESLLEHDESSKLSMLVGFCKSPFTASAMTGCCCCSLGSSGIV